MRSSTVFISEVSAPTVISTSFGFRYPVKGGRCVSYVYVHVYVFFVSIPCHTSPSMRHHTYEVNAYKDIF